MIAFLLFFGAVIAQATVFQFLKEYGIAFDAVLAVAIVLGFMRGDYRSLMIPALVAGLLSDGLSGVPFGTATAALVVALAALSFLAGVFEREHAVHFAMFALAGSALFSATVFAVTAAFDPAARMDVASALSLAGYNAAGTLFLYILSRWGILLKNRISGR